MRRIKKLKLSVSAYSSNVNIFFYEDLNLDCNEKDNNWENIWSKHGAVNDTSHLNCDKLTMMQDSGWKSFQNWDSYAKYFNQTLISHLKFQSNF